jgi:hypothetical protein
VLVEADISAALRVIGERAADTAPVRRRGDRALAPFMRTVWIPAALRAICDGFGPQQIEALLRKWLKILPNPLTSGDEAAGYRYELSILQAEFSLTQMLDRPVSGRIFFEQVLHENLDVGRPDQIGLVFNRRIVRKGHHPTPGRFRTRVITDGVVPSLSLDDRSVGPVMPNFLPS